MESIIALVSLLIAILVAIVGDSGLITFLNRSNVRYIRTHMLKRGSDFIQGIILLNSGKRVAKSVKLKLVYKNSIILNMQLEDDMVEKRTLIYEGGIGEKYVALEFIGLYSNSQAVVHITLDSKEDPSIKGTYDDVEIIEENHSYKRPLSDAVAIIFGLIALFWMCLSFIFP